MSDLFMKNEEKVTVIIPTYNRMGTIAESVQSVLDQTYSNLELLIVDDGSTDGTESVIKEFTDNRINYVRMDKNGGVANARNVGVSLAKTDWIAFQDSDDIWHKDKLEKQMTYAKEHPEYALIYSKYRLIYPDGEESVVPAYPNEVMEGDIFKPLLERNVIGAPTVLVKRETFMDIGGFDTAFHALEDWDFVIRFAKQYRIGFIDEMLMDARMLNGGVSSNIANYYEARCRMLRLYKDDMLREGVFNSVVTNILEKAQRRGILDTVQKMMQLYLSS